MKLPRPCCLKCSGKMNILSFIEAEEVIKKILKHLGLWDIKTRPPPRAIAPPGNIQIDHSDSPFPRVRITFTEIPTIPLRLMSHDFKAGHGMQ